MEETRMVRRKDKDQPTIEESRTRRGKIKETHHLRLTGLMTGADQRLDHLKGGGTKTLVSGLTA